MYYDSYTIIYLILLRTLYRTIMLKNWLLLTVTAILIYIILGMGGLLVLGRPTSFCSTFLINAIYGSCSMLLALVILKYFKIFK